MGVRDTEQMLLKRLSEITDEERRILDGAPLDIKEYTSKENLPFCREKLDKTKKEVSLRKHTRFTPFPQHSHNFVELVTVISGEMTHIIGEREITLSPFDLLIMNRHVCHAINRASFSDIGINIIISDSFFSSLVPELSEGLFQDFIKDNDDKNGEGSYLHFRTANNKKIENLIENLLFELTDPSHSDSAVTGTIALLFGYLSGEGLLVDASLAPTLTQKRKSRILDYIKSNYRSGTLTELAERTFISPPYLSKITMELFGKSFKELLFEERMRQAERLLAETDMKIGAVISAVGYENESYFHSKFREKHGQTPLSYRKERRG